MRSDLRRTCVLGMGCYAAFPRLQRAVSRHRLARPSGAGAALSCARCTFRTTTRSRTWWSGPLADGAAAALIGALTHPAQPRSCLPPLRSPPTASPGLGGPRLVDAATFCDYQTSTTWPFTSRTMVSKCACRPNVPGRAGREPWRASWTRCWRARACSPRPGSASGACIPAAAKILITSSFIGSQR